MGNLQSMEEGKMSDLKTYYSSGNRNYKQDLLNKFHQCMQDVLDECDLFDGEIDGLLSDELKDLGFSGAEISKHAGAPNQPQENFLNQHEAERKMIYFDGQKSLIKYFKRDLEKFKSQVK